MASKTITVRRTLDAPVREVWDAWTIPSQMKKWFSPEGMTTPDVSSDLQVGGKQMIHMLGVKGKFKGDFINNGEYKVIEPMQKIAFTWQWQNDPVISEVSIEFRKLSDNKTEVILKHKFPDEKSVGTHPQGWESTFNKLERFLR